VCAFLKPNIYEKSTYIYYEGDEVNHMYFMKEGECGFVLPQLQNLKYIDITEGFYFGMTDLVAGII